MYCKSCGKQIVDDSRFCSYCGIELNSVEKSQSDLVTKNHICPICSSTEVPTLTTPRFPTRGYWFSVSNAPVGADIHPCLAPQSINKAFQWDFTNPTFLSKSKFHNRLKNPTNNQAVGYA